MPATLPNTTTTDNYTDANAARLGGGSRFAQGSLLIANNPVAILITTGDEFGTTHDTEYPYVTPNAIPLIGGAPDPKDPSKPYEYIIGVQIRSAIKGSPAQVSGWLIEPQLAGLGPGTAFTQNISPGGSVTSNVPGTNLAYVENLVSVTSATQTGVQLVATGTMAFDGVTPIWVEFFAPWYSTNNANQEIEFELIDNAATVLVEGIGGSQTTGWGGAPIILKRRVTPAAGNHLFSVNALNATSATNFTVYSSNSLAGGAMYLSVITA